MVPSDNLSPLETLLDFNVRLMKFQKAAEIVLYSTLFAVDHYSSKKEYIKEKKHNQKNENK